MSRIRVKEVLSGLENRIQQDSPDNYIAVIYVGDYYNNLKEAEKRGVAPDNVFLGFDVVGPGATTREVVGTLEEVQANGYSVHELKGQPVGVNIVTPTGFKHKVLNS